MRLRIDGPIKVLLVDASAIVRASLAGMFRDDPRIEIVASAGRTALARRKVLEQKPDVIVLDLELPRHESITFLRVLRVHYPVPVIVCISEELADGPLAQRAFAVGAVEIVCKPSGLSRGGLRAFAARLAPLIRAAHQSKPVPLPRQTGAARRARATTAAGVIPNSWLVAIGASTGGTRAIERLLSAAPRDFPPVVMVQHMPSGFTRSFAGRLDQFSDLAVSEAVDGDRPRSGSAILARGDTQMEMLRTAGLWQVRYGSTKTFHHHCPSVDVLFNSVARVAGPRGIGILLTGMGGDGARGLLKMRKCGALTFAQDRESCVVYGMPKVAAELGAAECIAPPEEIPQLVLDALAKRSRPRIKLARKELRAAARGRNPSRDR